VFLAGRPVSLLGDAAWPRWPSRRWCSASPRTRSPPRPVFLAAGSIVIAAAAAGWASVGEPGVSL
jgi:hypothetical protein